VTSTFPKDAIAIFGGSFNPVHIGHVRLVEEIQRLFQFSTLYIIPNGNPPHKPPFEIPSEQRLALVKLAFEGVPQTQISTFEIENTEPSYALWTIEHIKKQHPGKPLYFILGADSFYTLPEWYEFPDVLHACSYLVVTRAGYVPSNFQDIIIELRDEKLISEVKPAPAPFQRLFKTKQDTVIAALSLDLPEVSSTEIRLRLQLKQTVDGLVPDKVAQYLKTTSVCDT